MNSRRILGGAFVALTMTVALAGAALGAADPTTSGNKLQCFDGTTDGGFNGTCTLVRNGARLDTIDGDADPNNAYAGAYVLNTNLGGKLISRVNKLSFTFTGGPVTGGSPRLSVGIDENDDGTTESYAFVDAANCGVVSGGTVGLDCPVFYGATLYPDWASFAEANPTFRISDAIPFVIVDQPFEGRVTNVQLGRAAAKS